MASNRDNVDKNKISNQELYNNKMTIIDDNGKFMKISSIKDFKMLIFISIDDCDNKCVSIIKTTELVAIKGQQLPKITPILITTNSYHDSINNIQTFKIKNKINIKSVIIDNYSLMAIFHKLNNDNYSYKTLPMIYLVHPDNKHWLEIENSNNFNDATNNIYKNILELRRM
ncbi:hypothetical protein CAXC1_330104 [Candidatus Xenohaliotis californiensis]|uniref:Uncharacterized protein n=1 Tax=Candidatus Xenohaliotis californiensis TaxID=84677 RepID=A0ABM9N8R4_9RICK|nr:hypothetical protein CAXC1_330104 [Candidatus Xenohaliotis californiensis]